MNLSWDVAQGSMRANECNGDLSIATDCCAKLTILAQTAVPAPKLHDGTNAVRRRWHPDVSIQQVARRH